MKLLENNHEAVNLVRISNINLEPHTLSALQIQTEDTLELLSTCAVPAESSHRYTDIPLNNFAVLPSEYRGVVAANHNSLNLYDTYDEGTRTTRLSMIGDSPFVNVDLIHTDKEPVWRVKPHLSSKPVWWYTHGQVVELLSEKLLNHSMGSLVDFIHPDNEIAARAIASQLRTATRNRTLRTAYTTEDIMIHQAPFPPDANIDPMEHLFHTFNAAVHARMIVEENPGTRRDVNLSILTTSLLGDHPITTEFVCQQAGRSKDGSLRQGISAILSSDKIPETSLRQYGIGIRMRATTSANVGDRLIRAAKMLQASTGMAPIDLAS